ncbi:hypothetical protein [Xaviernesmea oryzae]
MRKNLLTTGLVALTIAGTTIATASQAEAHNNFGRGLAAGIAGTLIGGALVASASHPAYAAPVYAAPTYPAYAVPAYAPEVVVSQPVCRVVWHQDGWGDMYRTRQCD